MTPDEIVSRATDSGVQLVRFLYCDNGGTIRGKASVLSGLGGRLNVGMKAYYADSRGKVHTYRVKWWKLTKPTTSASWAWASQSVPSMTLQTCVGSNSEYRLMVRLVEVR